MKITRKIQRHLELIIRHAMALESSRPGPAAQNNSPPEKAAAEPSVK